jgi:hypothetical protein
VIENLVAIFSGAKYLQEISLSALPLVNVSNFGSFIGNGISWIRKDFLTSSNYCGEGILYFLVL